MTIERGNGRTRYVEIDGANALNRFTIAAGALGWIDTDCSGSQVPSNAVAVFVQLEPAAAQNCGARALGSPQTELTFDSGQHLHTLVTWPATKHLELYRAAGNNVYVFMGYFT